MGRMPARLFNLALAAGAALLSLVALAEGVRHFDWTAVLYPLVAVCWLAGAIGVFFRSRLAWSASLLGVGTLAASSVTQVFTMWVLLPVGTDPTDGIGFGLVAGSVGLLISAAAICALISIRRSCFSLQENNA